MFLVRGGTDQLVQHGYVWSLTAAPEASNDALLATLMVWHKSMGRDYSRLIITWKIFDYTLVASVQYAGGQTCWRKNLEPPAGDWTKVALWNCPVTDSSAREKLLMLPGPGHRDGDSNEELRVTIRYETKGSRECPTLFSLSLSMR